jgi:hypothetical protein
MRLMKDEEGVSEVFGYVIILGIALTCLAMLTLYAAGAINTSKDDSQMKSVSQAFTVGDSRLSKARFSTSIFQETPFKLNDGVMFVNGSSEDSYIVVYGIDGTPVYNGTMGTIKCVTDSGEVGYQDGGVFALYPDGSSIMLSPPDFDYNGVTLTLPIMHIDGNSSASYSDSAVLLDAASVGETILIYPNKSVGFNPLPQNKTINITIKTDYYKAWESYINERTRATAVTNPAKKMVNISLSSGKGRFSGSVENGFSTKYMDTSYYTPIEIFKFDLYPKNTGNDPYVRFTSVSTDSQLTLYIGRTNGQLNKLAAQVEIEYVKGGITEKFTGYLPYHRKTQSDELFYVDLLDTNDEPYSDASVPGIDYGVLYYDADSSPQSVTWGTIPNSYDSGVVPDYMDSSDVNIGQYKSSFDVIQHYLRLMAMSDSSGPLYEARNHNYEPTSSYVLQFKSNEDIKYLYITEGTLKISLNGRGA